MQTNQMLYLNSVIQINPIHRKASRFDLTSRFAAQVSPKPTNPIN